jgi:hypothetical protein
METDNNNKEVTSTEKETIDTQKVQSAEENSNVKEKKKQDSKKNALTNKAKEIFDNYPNIDKIYKTDDELYFFEKCDACNHANTLKSRNVIEITRK